MRLQEVELETASPEQQRILLDIQKSRNGDLSGPFKCWAHSPEFAQVAQAVGKFCRYDTGLELKDSELAIITVAAYWQSQAEWQIHAPIAIDAGICPRAVEKIRTGIVPNFQKPIEKYIHQAAKELLETKRLSDGTYAELKNLLSDQMIVNLVGLIGYYSMVALTLNAFQVAKDGVELPFVEPSH